MHPKTERVTPAAAGASPRAAAALAAGIVYLWAEAALRLWFAHGGDAVLRLWPQRAGDVAAMWLAMSLLGLAAYVVLARAWRARAGVGTIRAWTIALVLSALIAPLLGEWGQAIGI